MDVLLELANGFASALTLENLAFALIGCLLGTLIGVLPGIGPVAGVALLIPLTMNLNPAGAIIMLAAIFYGTTYGGTITSVLLNTPGEAASAITTLDGYQMTKQGRAGSALTIAAVGSSSAARQRPSCSSSQRARWARWGSRSDRRNSSRWSWWACRCWWPCPEDRWFAP